MKINPLIVMTMAGLLAASPAYSRTQNMEGTVISLKPGLIVIDIWGDDEEHDFMINRMTAFQRFDSLSDLTFGDKVRVYYQGNTDPETATAIVKELSSRDIPVL